MWHSDIVSSNLERDAPASRLSSFPATGNFWITNSLALVLITALLVPGAGWAEVNYFQMINGNRNAESDEYIRDLGYAVYFNFEGKQFLLDTGHSQNNFVNNLDAAGIDTGEIDFVILSHSHIDHTSGWKYLRRQRPEVVIYIPPGQVFSYSEKLTEVNDFLRMTSNVILLHTHDEAGSVGIKDELSLLIRTTQGPYLFTTNSHTDFIMKLEKAEKILGESIYFHSGHTARRVSPDKEIMEIAKKTKARKVKKMSSSHSRPSHDEIFKQVFGAGYVPAILGKKVTLEPASN